MSYQAELSYESNHEVSYGAACAAGYVLRLRVRTQRRGTGSVWTQGTDFSCLLAYLKCNMTLPTNQKMLHTVLQIRDNFTSKSRQGVQAIFHVGRNWIICRCFSTKIPQHELEIMICLSGNVLQVFMPGPVTWSVAQSHVRCLHSPCNGAHARESQWISMVFRDIKRQQAHSPAPSPLSTEVLPVPFVGPQ